jgi:hypothetical protein
MVQEDSNATIRTSKASAEDWDRAKLIEMGVKREFVLELDDKQTHDLVKGLLYVWERDK